MKWEDMSAWEIIAGDNHGSIFCKHSIVGVNTYFIYTKMGGGI